MSKTAMTDAQRAPARYLPFFTLLFLILIADLAVGLKLKDCFIVDYVKSCFLVPLNALDKLFVALSNIPAVRGAVKDRRVSLPRYLVDPM